MKTMTPLKGFFWGAGTFWGLGTPPRRGIRSSRPLPGGAVAVWGVGVVSRLITLPWHPPCWFSPYRSSLPLALHPPCRPWDPCVWGATPTAEDTSGHFPPAGITESAVGATGDSPSYFIMRGARCHSRGPRGAPRSEHPPTYNWSLLRWTSGPFSRRYAHRYSRIEARPPVLP